MRLVGLNSITDYYWHVKVAGSSRLTLALLARTYQVIKLDSTHRSQKNLIRLHPFAHHRLRNHIPYKDRNSRRHIQSF